MNARRLGIVLSMPALAGSMGAQAAFGDLDTSFGSTGVATVDVSDGGNDWFNFVFVDGEDRIYAFAEYNKLVGDTLEVGTRMMRFTKDGVLDETFGTAGALDLGPLSGSFAVDEEGRFLVATSKDVDDDLLLTRYTAAGAPDDSFGTNGVATLVVDAPDYIYG